MVEALEPFRLHPTSIWYIYNVFEHLLMGWMGVWRHTHTITTTNMSPDLGELASKSWVLNLCKRCHYAMVDDRAYQTASHIHLICIYCGWALSGCGNENRGGGGVNNNQPIRQQKEQLVKLSATAAAAVATWHTYHRWLAMSSGKSSRRGPAMS